MSRPVRSLRGCSSCLTFDIDAYLCEDALLAKRMLDHSHLSDEISSLNEGRRRAPPSDDDMRANRSRFDIGDYRDRIEPAVVEGQSQFVEDENVVRAARHDF